MNKGTGTQFELTKIERLEILKYRFLPADELSCEHKDSVLVNILKAGISERYKKLSEVFINPLIKLYFVLTGRRC